MRLDSNLLDPPGTTPESLPLPAGINRASASTKVDEKPDSGHILRCGKMHLWSVPMEYVFMPRAERFTHIITVNAEIFALAHEDRRLGDILAGAVSTIDGRVLQGICKLLYPNHEMVRQNGSNFITDLAEHCRKHSERLFLVGSSEKANSLATQRLRNTFTGLQVSGFSPPLQDHPFPQDWNALILDQIARFAPHHLVVCFGPKKQEYWIHENSSQLAALGVQCAYGLGGTIDFLSGAKPRAPKWIEFIGAEWLFRLACEPRARFRRTLVMFKMPFYALKTAREIKPLNGLSEE
ncbi:MAG: WecB/TagA/CpsF family glycosyltransferase [Candidatus Acidiferrales bacterium]